MKRKVEESRHGSAARLANQSLEAQISTIERLNFVDVRKLALINDHFLNLTTDFFRRKLAESFIFIDGDYISRDPINNSNDTIGVVASDLRDAWSRAFEPSSSNLIFSKGNWIEIRNLDTVLNIMAYFGDSVKVLRINQKISRHVVFKKIIESINTHCSESLEYLDTDFSFQNLFEHLAPMKKVNQVNLKFSNVEEGNTTFAMDELFPEMRHLVLELNRNLNSSFLLCRFQHLEHLKIRALYNIGSWAMRPGSYEEQLVMKNPQIKELDLQFVSGSLLKVAAEHLTNLDTLIVTRFISEDALHFSTVTKFLMTDVSGAPVNITFSNLQEVQMSCMRDRCDAWIDFFAKHSQVNRLFIEHTILNDELFGKLTANLTNLVDFSYQSFQMVHPTTLIEFMDKHDKLQTAYFEPCSQRESYALQQKLATNWTISNHPKGTLFQRKS